MHSRLGTGGALLAWAARGEATSAPLLAAANLASQVVLNDANGDGVCRSSAPNPQRSDRLDLSAKVRALPDGNETTAFGQLRISSLGLAVLADDPGLLRQLFDRGAQWPDRDAAAAAMYDAAQHASPALLGVLLKHGVAADARRPDGMSPLMAAAWANRSDNAQVLLDAGADAGLVLPNGSSVLIAAVVCRNQPLVDALIRHGARPDANTKKQADKRGIRLDAR